MPPSLEAPNRDGRALRRGRVGPAAPADRHPQRLGRRGLRRHDEREAETLTVLVRLVRKSDSHGPHKE
jgi:hypothetical protein